MDFHLELTSDRQSYKQEAIRQWYYAESDNRVGPVGDEEFQILANTGKIRPETLVWNSSMSDWQEYGQVTGTSGSGADRGLSDQSFCVECGKSYSQGDMIRYGNSWVCAACKPVFVQKIKEGLTVSGVMEYAGFWIRFGAKIIDQFIIGGINMIIIIPLAILVGIRAAKTGDPSTSMALSLIMNFSGFFLYIAYTTFFIGRYGATPGKMVCKLKVVTPSGGRVTYLRAFARYFGELVNLFTLMIGYIIAAFDSEKRALHDHICSTRVIKRQ